MHLRPELAPARLPFAGATYHFCSFECARRFAQRPEAYASA
jgi:YHS domain-containing protein